jgi:cytochrome P450
MKEGKQKTCFLSEFIAEKHDRRFTEEELLHIVGAMLQAGTDTTSSTLNQLAAAATLWPDWVERIRKQLDEVCGSNAERLPTMADLPRLPLVKATAKECLRWK